MLVQMTYTCEIICSSSTCVKVCKSWFWGFDEKKKVKNILPVQNANDGIWLLSNTETWQGWWYWLEDHIQQGCRSAVRWLTVVLGTRVWICNRRGDFPTLQLGIWGIEVRRGLFLASQDGALSVQMLRLCSCIPSLWTMIEYDDDSPTSVDTSKCRKKLFSKM